MLLMNVAGLTGCSMAAEREPVAGESQAYTGLVFLSGCSATESAKVYDANAILVRYIYGSQLPACLRDHFFATPSGAWTEEIMARLRAQNISAISCETLNRPGERGTNGRAPIGIENERIRLDHQFLSSANAARIASVMLHEIGHNKGYMHFGSLEYRHSVNEALERCVLEGEGQPTQTDPGRRSDFPGAVELQRVGGSVGTDYLDYCTAGTFASAQTVRLIASGSDRVIDGLALQCGSDSATVGSVTAGTTDSCPAAHVVAAVRGYASETGVQQVQFGCTNGWELIAYRAGASITPVISHWLTPAGNPSPNARYYERTCPAGSAIMGLAGKRDGNGVGSFSIICDEAPASAPPMMLPRVSRPVVGASGITTAQNRCSGDTFMNGIFGHANASRVDRLGVQCGAEPVRWGPPLSYALDAVGGDARGISFSASVTLPPSQMAIGDNNRVSATSQATILAGSMSAGDVTVELTLAHARPEQLRVRIVHDGYASTAFDRGTPLMVDQKLRVSTSEFAGRPASGDYRIYVDDLVSGTMGALIAWDLKVSSQQVSPTCPNDRAMVGLEYLPAAGGGFQYVAPICADYFGWKTGSSRQVSPIANAVGSPGSGPSSYSCPVRTFAKGMRLGGGNGGLDSFTLICESP